MASPPSYEMDSMARKALIADEQEVKVEERRRDPHTKWKTTLGVGAGLATVVLATNIGVLVWAGSSSTDGEGSAAVYQGPCYLVGRATVAAELVVNILSTLLLGASNYAAQLLTAPTRKDLDRQHARGNWLDVGVSSVRNMRYNSVIFTSHLALDYQAALVTEDFLHGGYWNQSRAQAVFGANVQQISQMAQHADQLIRLDGPACLQAYSTNRYETIWRNVLVVANINNANSSLLNVYSHTAAAEVNDLNWVCHGDVHNLYAPEYSNCDSAIVQSGTTWTIPKVPACPQNQDLRVGYPYNIFDGSQNCPDFVDVEVDYCLAESFSPLCTLDVSKRLLAGVIVCNIAKILCMLGILFARGLRPLSTIGDAIASFIERPDSATAGMGALEVGAVTSGVWRHFDQYPPVPWTRQKRRWWYAVPRLQLNLTFLISFIPWLTTLIILIKLSIHPQLGEFGSFGVVSTDDLLSTTLNGGVLANVVLANTPQIIITFVCIFYNDAFTRMLLNIEYIAFAKIRKPLRVSRPRGQQRSTYWLQLPLRYSVPIMSTMVLLHWLVSRSIFLVRIIVYNTDGLRVPGRDIDACGFSPLAILLAFCLSTVMIGSLVGVGGFRRFEAGMPVAGACSVAVAAAVHLGEGESEDARFSPLMYGIVSRTSSRGSGERASWQQRGPDWDFGRRAEEHVSFSSKEVSPLEDGKIYR
ncbi:hypothetical protein PRZ48_014091 [Zasmidium cellare]|uniref:DUF6536 domain-containing protein n=1 Tax=Zasmidium cellare TaxID=395010 RepID=A0ABR0E008_ZASCE|nr:hypothetical protein PRZ48_014091 [Zasmidium cellare]